MAKLLPLSNILDEHEFWAGTKIRIQGVGLHVNEPHEDYYDYMLALLPTHSERMILVNISSGAGKAKAGLCHLAQPAIKEGKRQVVLGKELKRMLGEENVYLIVEHEA
jgi:hypothetical protein